MNHARRVVTSIAVGLALVVAGAAVTSWIDEPSNGGWFMYAPNSTQIYNAPGGTDWSTSGVWLAAIGIWFAVSWRLFRSNE